jgi:hypothetical protein
MRAILLMLVWLPALAGAHIASDSFLSLDARGETISGHWDIALRDLDLVLNLDGDNDGQLRWGEVRPRSAEISAYVLQRLSIAGDGRACTLRGAALSIDRHQGEAFAVLPLTVSCGASVRSLSMSYRLLEQVDSNHRGLLDLQLNGSTYTAALAPQAQAVSFGAHGGARWQALRQFLYTGIEHIWSGYDHLLFLLSLLLPAVWRRQRPHEAHATLSAAAVDVAKVVTAFTVAHSITLALATFDVVRLPARLSESAIALSIVLAALNNLWPVVTKQLWVVASAFGLLHGFGFANVLSDLGLAPGTLSVALFGFNAGVEVGQLAIVAIFLPLAYWMRETLFYRRVVVGGGSAMVAALGAVWLLERALGLQLLSW